jgi:3-hydroxyisobutyrate dehydrogenase-like beta-hydroxyacid dehydrogenase
LIVFYQASIGFLGLGNMGKHMATNLIAANHHVTIFDANPQALDHFKEQSRKIFFI